MLLEGHGASFVDGYNLALACPSPKELNAELRTFERGRRGFAFEGAAMALALLDGLTFASGRRIRSFLASGADPYIYLVYVGVGWACARLRRRPASLLRTFDPILQPLAADGYGFHQAFFHPDTVVWRQKQLGGHRVSKRVFDQGVGRALWFVLGADAKRISRTIGDFAQARHDDLWSGVGLAAAYAGGASDDDLEWLAARRERDHLAQGAAFAAAARQRADDVTPETTRACRALLGLDPDRAAALVARALEEASSSPVELRYELWRQKTREFCARQRDLRIVHR